MAEVRTEHAAEALTSRSETESMNGTVVRPGVSRYWTMKCETRAALDLSRTLRKPYSSLKSQPEPTATTSCCHCHWTQSRGSFIRSPPSHHISTKYISMLSSHLLFGLQNKYFPRGFPARILYIFFVLPVLATCPCQRNLLRVPHCNNAVWQE